MSVIESVVGAPPTSVDESVALSRAMHSQAVKDAYPIDILEYPPHSPTSLAN